MEEPTIIDKLEKDPTEMVEITSKGINKKTGLTILIIVLFFAVILPIVGLVYLLITGNLDLGEEKGDDVVEVVEEEDVAEEDEEITDDDLANEGWINYENTSSFFDFSLSIPKDAYACSCSSADTAGCSSDFDDCEYWGITLEDPDTNQPFGIRLEYTTLEETDRISPAFKEEYNDYIDSDIDFGCDFQVMVAGQNEDGNYIKYYFVKDGNIYMPKIYTDVNNSNLGVYKEILESWSF